MHAVENAYYQVLVVGDSHVRRMAEVAYPFMPDCMAGVTVSFHHKGGAGVQFCWNIPADTKYDIIVLCIGSNNIANGMEPSDLFSRLNFHAGRCMDSGLCTEVIIMGLWPRANRQYNAKMRVFNSFKSTDARIFFWKWSSHFRYRILPDRTHLRPHCYKRALKYLASPILHVIKYFLHK